MERQGGTANISKLTEEELRILKECRDESFFYRCLPAMLIGNSLFHAAYRRGAIAQKRYGLKQFGISILAFVAGKFSYIQPCKEKIIRNLPANSVLVQNITGKKSTQLETDNQVNDSLVAQAQQPTNPQQATTSQTEGFVSYDDLRKKSREVQQQQQIKSVTSGQREAAKKMENFDIPKHSERPSEKPKKFHVNKYGDIIYEED